MTRKTIMNSIEKYFHAIPKPPSGRSQKEADAAEFLDGSFKESVLAIYALIDDKALKREFANAAWKAYVIGNAAFDKHVVAPRWMVLGLGVPELLPEGAFDVHISSG